MTIQVPFFQTQKQHIGLKLMFTFALLTIIASGLGLFLDPRATAILGTPTWIKTFKFAVSMLLYAASLLWLVHLTKDRVATIAGQVIGFLMSLELVVIIIQGFRANPMHYNLTTGLDEQLWSVMSITIMFVMLAFIVLIVRVWQKLRDLPVLTWAIRLGLILTIFGFFQGNLMTQGTPEQLAALKSGQQVSLLGAHTVGNPNLTPDNGNGLPLLGWSTQYGDLRIGHFVGTHALQIIPLLGLWLSRRRHLSQSGQLQLLGIGVFGYAGLFVLTTWQALRGQPLFAPDVLTLATLGTLLIVVGVMAWLVWSRQRQSVIA